MLLAGSWFDKIIDFILGLSAIVPQTVYFIYTSCTSLLDMFQMLIRKLAGLDTYYVNGQEQTGDMLTSFIRGVLGIDPGQNYSTLSTVFWSLVIFSVILLVLTTIISLIKAHYNYDSKKSQPMTIISASIKSIFTMALVPVVTIFGLYLSQALLKFLDQITSPASTSSVVEVFGNDAATKLKSETIADGTKLYCYYDAFGFGEATSQVTFSGTLFKISAYDCNRVRSGAWGVPTSPDSSDRFTNFGLFYDSNGDRDKVAEKIDVAFVNGLRLTSNQTAVTAGDDAWSLASSYLSGPYMLGLINVGKFSKFNTGLVYYFYDLWAFNFFLAFAGLAACFTLFINIIFGLISRLITSLALFLVYSPAVGISPLDGGNAYKSWKKEFISQILMAFGTVVGMNIFFIILPFINTITFFDPKATILNGIMNMLIMIAGLTVVKKFTKLLSGFIGAADANDVGGNIANDVKATGIKSSVLAMGAAGVGIAAGKVGLGMTKGIVTAPAKLIHSAKMKHHRKKMSSDPEYRKAYEKKEEARQAKLDLKLEKKEKRREAFANSGIIKGLSNIFTKEVKKPIYEMDNGKIKTDDAGNPIIKKDAHGNDMYQTVRETRAGLKAFGTGLLDLTGTSLKLATDLTGISKLGKDLGEAGVDSKFKENIQKFGQAVGLFKKDNAGNAVIPKGLLTKKQKDDAKSDEAKANTESNRKLQEAIADNSKKTLSKIDELIKILEKKK